MAGTSQGTSYRASHSVREEGPSAWAGWVVFAGAMLILLGIFGAALLHLIGRLTGYQPRWPK